MTEKDYMKNEDSTNNEDYMKIAFEEAYYGVRNNQGGPFGAVIVLNGEIIGHGHNKVTASKDPTAHAEVVAIRAACKKLNTFQLPEEAVIYTTCEPCPMCLSAIYWAKIKTMYYCSTRNDADAIGFSDKLIYDEIKLDDMSKRQVKCKHLELPDGEELFREWTEKPDKEPY